MTCTCVYEATDMVQGIQLYRLRVQCDACADYEVDGTEGEV